MTYKCIYKEPITLWPKLEEKTNNIAMLDNAIQNNATIKTVCDPVK